MFDSPRGHSTESFFCSISSENSHYPDIIFPRFVHYFPKKPVRDIFFYMKYGSLKKVPPLLPSDPARVVDHMSQVTGLDVNLYSGVTDAIYLNISMQKWWP